MKAAIRNGPTPTRRTTRSRSSSPSNSDAFTTTTLPSPSHDVDVMLTGHRHSYQRAESGSGVHHADKKQPYAVDTVFLVTAMTIKRGNTKVAGWERFAQERDGNFTLTRWGDYAPIFGVFRVDGDTLSYRAVDGVGDHYDAFELKKDEQGRKTMHNGAEAFGPVWTVENAGPHMDWRE